MKLSFLPAAVAATASFVSPAAAYKFHSLHETARMVEECYRVAWIDRMPPPPRCHDLVHIGFTQLYLHGFQEGMNRGNLDGTAKGFNDGHANGRRIGFAEGVRAAQTACPVVDWDTLREEASLI